MMEESKDSESASVCMCLSPKNLLPSKPPETWGQTAPTCQGFPQAFGEGQYLKAKHELRRLLCAWAEQELPDRKSVV